MIKVGDKVKVVDQEIFGVVLRISDLTNEVVIQDEHSEYDSPDDELIYRFSELEVIEKLQVENEFLKTTIKLNYETEIEETKREFIEYSLGKL